MANKRAPSRERSVKCQRCSKTFLTRHSGAKWCPVPCRRLAERASWNSYNGRNRTARRAAHRRRYTENAAAVRKRTAAYAKTPAGKLAIKKSGENARLKHPEKYAARMAVGVAVRTGRLVKKPCRRCGARKVEAHHTDYTKPLKVVWLCSPCHRQEHKR